MHNGSNRQSRMVWLTGIFIILLIAGGVVLGLFLSRKAPSDQQPVALGGSADATSVSGGAASSVGGATSKSAAQSSHQTSFHVTPTFTLKNREPDASPLVVVRLAEINAAAVAAARRLH